jgi:hypothetical protein
MGGIMHDYDFGGGRDGPEPASHRSRARRSTRDRSCDRRPVPDGVLRNHDHHGVAHGTGGLHNTIRERTPTEVRELLESAKPPGIAGGQDDAPDVHENGL